MSKPFESDEIRGTFDTSVEASIAIALEEALGTSVLVENYESTIGDEVEGKTHLAIELDYSQVSSTDDCDTVEELSDETGSDD